VWKDKSWGATIRLEDWQLACRAAAQYISFVLNECSLRWQDGASVVCICFTHGVRVASCCIPTVPANDTLVVIIPRIPETVFKNPFCHTSVHLIERHLVAMVGEDFGLVFVHFPPQTCTAFSNIPLHFLSRLTSSVPMAELRLRDLRSPRQGSGACTYKSESERKDMRLHGTIEEAENVNVKFITCERNCPGHGVSQLLTPDLV
jgi:hypothetical protein